MCDSLVLLCRFNETERLLKEVQAAHVSLTKQTDTLRKNHEALQLQQNKYATHTHTRARLVSFDLKTRFLTLVAFC